MCTYSNVMISCILAIYKSFVELAYTCSINMPIWSNYWLVSLLVLISIYINMIWLLLDNTTNVDAN